MSAVWSSLATTHGVVTGAAPAAADGRGPDVLLHVPGWDEPVPYQVKVFDSPVFPSRLRSLRKTVLPAHPLDGPAPRLLLLVPSATAGLLSAAHHLDISVLVAPRGRDDDVTGMLLGDDGKLLDLRARTPADRPPQRRRGRQPWGTFAVAFAVLEDLGRVPPQAVIAQRTGLSQARVSQVLRELVPLDTLADATVDAPAVLRDHLTSWLLARYPRHPRLSTTWLSLEQPVDAVGQVEVYLRHQSINHAVSGEVAADRLAPWSRPTTGWVWTASLVDLEAVAATPVDPADASLTIAVPDDPHLLAEIRDVGPRTSERGTVAPWRVWLDLAQHGQAAAAQHLRDAIESGHLS